MRQPTGPIPSLVSWETPAVQADGVRLSCWTSSLHLSCHSCSESKDPPPPAQTEGLKIRENFTLNLPEFPKQHEGSQGVQAEPNPHTHTQRPPRGHRSHPGLSLYSRDPGCTLSPPQWGELRGQGCDRLPQPCPPPCGGPQAAGKGPCPLVISWEGLAFVIWAPALLTPCVGSCPGPCGSDTASDAFEPSGVTSACSSPHLRWPRSEAVSALSPGSVPGLPSCSVTPGHSGDRELQAFLADAKCLLPGQPLQH